MRLFVALDIPQETRTAIAGLMERLRRPGPKWVDAQNLHLTLKFIGETTDVQGITRALSLVKADSVELGLRGLGSFPRVLWIGVAAPPGLAQLARRIDEALEPLGIARESRPFSPHLTLARVKDGRMPQFNEQPDFGTFRVSEFVLYASKLAASGPTYTALQRFPLVHSAQSA